MNDLALNHQPSVPTKHNAQPLPSQETRGEDYWRPIVKAWSESGLTQVDFCQKNGYTFSTFAYWKRKLQAASKPSQFQKVVCAPRPGNTLLRIRLPSGLSLEFPEMTSPTYLKTVLEGLL